MGAHINAEGLFQSDKYPGCPAGKVPLSVKDITAQPLLWQYAQIHRVVDAEFSADLETALLAAGYNPTPTARWSINNADEQDIDTTVEALRRRGDDRDRGAMTAALLTMLPGSFDYVGDSPSYTIVRIR